MSKNSNLTLQKDVTSNALPILSQVSIKQPCLMSWSEMDGDAAKRFCEHCQKHVHNFSEMSAQNVAQLIGSGESICAKIQRRSDGSIITKNTISRRSWFGHFAAIATGALVVLMFGGCKDNTHEVLGDVCPTPVPPPADSTVAPAVLGEGVRVDELGEYESP